MSRVLPIKCHSAPWLFLLLFTFCNTSIFGATNLSISACNSYLLPWNTTPTTVSGLYSHTYPKSPAPDSIVNITLTINVGPTASVLGSTLPSTITNIIDEQFDVLNAGVTYTPTGWFQTNKSAPTGTTAWFSGPFLSNGTPSFSPESGNGCIVADYLNTSGNGTISNWLISPTVTMQNGDVLSFYTIQNPSTPYADRMEVRMSTNGASTNVGTTATSTGDFTTSLITINNGLTPYVYPQTWTIYTVAISGLVAPTSGRIAFRYFVTSGGPLGANSDMIGLDNVVLKRVTTPVICAGNTINLTVNTTGGVGPYTAVITNGVSNSTHPAYTNGNLIAKIPTINTTYALVSVADVNGCLVATKTGTPSVNVLQPIAINLSATQCTSYTLPWGNSVTNSGIYYNTYIGANGCDSIVSYNVTIKNASTTNLVVTSCNQYILPWSVTPVMVSGTYSHMYQNVALCDSNVNIIVTIKLPVSTSTSVSACNNYLLPWGAAVNASGTYSNTYVGANLCDSISNIIVTILPNSASTNTIVACSSFLLPWNTIPTLVSGLYSHNYFNVLGCDSISNIQLIIKQPQIISTAISACNSYLLPWQSVAVTTSGTYSNTYVGANNCDSISVLILTINTTNVTNKFDTAFSNLILPWGSVVYASGTYSYTYQNLNSCDSVVNIFVYITPPLKLNLNVMLSGAFNTSNNLMNDSLRVLGLIPTSDPYRLPPYNTSFVHINNNFVQTVGSNVLTTTGNNAIVDWVFVQLRAGNDSTIVVSTKAALVQRDGDIVDANDGISPVSFSNIYNNLYFVSVKHRNHLGVMTKNKLPVSNIPLFVNFSSTSTLLFQYASKGGNLAPLSGPTRIQNGIRTLYAGNLEISLTNFANKYITYNSWSYSDRAALLSATGGTSTINGYSIFDADMNGYARFNGLFPDRLVILQNCVNSTNVIINEQLP